MADAKPTIWIPRVLSQATLERAARDYEVILNEDDSLSSAEDIVAMSARVDAMITRRCFPPMWRRASIRA